VHEQILVECNVPRAALPVPEPAVSTPAKVDQAKIYATEVDPSTPANGDSSKKTVAKGFGSLLPTGIHSNSDIDPSTPGNLDSKKGSVKKGIMSFLTPNPKENVNEAPLSSTAAANNVIDLVTSSSATSGTESSNSPVISSSSKVNLLQPKKKEKGASSVSQSTSTVLAPRPVIDASANVVQSPTSLESKKPEVNILPTKKRRAEVLDASQDQAAEKRQKGNDENEPVQSLSSSTAGSTHTASPVVNVLVAKKRKVDVMLEN
jgi:hypothetical protein